MSFSKKVIGPLREIDIIVGGTIITLAGLLALLVRGGTGASASLSGLNVTPASPVVGVDANISVRYNSNAGINGIPISFFADNNILLGNSQTDSSGNAELTYQFKSIGNHVIFAALVDASGNPVIKSDPLTIAVKAPPVNGPDTATVTLDQINVFQGTQVRADISFSLKGAPVVVANGYMRVRLGSNVIGNVFTKPNVSSFSTIIDTTGFAAGDFVVEASDNASFAA